ncbi:MAG: hypothetical protein IPF93_01440 [Saprospiraceae bacterium]|nr:hypothetical protein [Saprospiraceae bacterium]
MKNEPWIDKVYKEHLLQPVSSLNMDHWLQAESMITAQEKKDQRRRWLWILFFGTIVGGMIAYGLLALSSKSAPLPVAPPTQLIENNEPMAQKDMEPIRESGSVALTIPPSLEAIELRKGQPDHFVSSTQKSSGQTKSALGKNSKSVVLINPDDYSKATREPSPTNDLSKKDPLLAGQFLNTVNDEIIVNQVHRQAVAEVQELDVKFKMLSYDRGVHGSSLTQGPIKVTRDTWKESGIRMSMASQAVNGVSRAGIGQLGIDWYRLKGISKKIFYGVGLGYSSSFNNNHYAQVITAYQFQSFGGTSENYGIKPQWLQLLHGQINLGIQNDRHRLVAGLKPQYLIGARGKVDQIQFTDNPPVKDLASAKVSSLNTGWLQNDFLNTFSLTTVIAYDYKIMRQIGIGLQAEHTVRSAYKPLENNIHQPGLASWNIGFRFSYILN